MASKKAIGTYLDRDVYNALGQFSEESGISITRIVQDAVTEYLRARSKELGTSAKAKGEKNG